MSPRTVEPYKMSWQDIFSGGWRLWRAQVNHTKRHLAQEQFRGLRLRHLGDGHFMGFRPWCDTQLHACPDSRRACCTCLHGESYADALEDN